MAGLNRVMIIGHLGRDPEMRHTQSGTAICNLNIATSESWTDKQGEKQERVEWHRAVAFSKQAEILEKYLSKGSQIYVEGRLQTRQYDKDGQTHYATEIVISNFVFLGGGSQQPQQRPQQQPQSQGGYAPPAYDDGSGIPF